MAYRRAFSTLGCPELLLDEVLALAARHSIDAVELRVLKGTTDLPAHFAEQFKAPADLLEHTRSSSVKIAALDTSFRLIEHTTKDREALLQFVPWAEGVGVRYLRVFDGGNTGGADDIRDAAKTIDWWRDLRAQNSWKVDLMVETHDAFTTTDTIQRFIASVPDVAILWDSHHTWKKGGENPLATWRTLQRNIVHVHVKDSISVPSGKHPYTYVLPGEGDFPAASLLPVLQKEFNGMVSLEWEKMWHPSLSPLDEALIAASKHQWW